IGSSAGALSHGSFICSPDPEEVEDGALTVPVGKLISDSGNLYSLRSESSLVPMMMDDGLDELESDEEPLPHDRVALELPKENKPSAMRPQTPIEDTLNEEAIVNQCESETNLVNSRKSSMDEIDQVCLSTSQTMLRLRRHADRVLEATEAAEKRLRERLNWLSDKVSGQTNEYSKAEREKHSTEVAPEPRTRSTCKHNDSSLLPCNPPHDSTNMQPSVRSPIPKDEAVLEGLPNSPSWTSGSEEPMLSIPKSRSVPPDLPPLMFGVSSGDEENQSTSSNRENSKRRTPVAAIGQCFCGVTHRTASPPFTEPTILSAMTTVTPLAHTPGRIRGSIGEPEWDSKRSSLVEDPQDILAEEESYTSDTNDSPRGVSDVCLRQLPVASPTMERSHTGGSTPSSTEKFSRQCDRSSLESEPPSAPSQFTNNRVLSAQPNLNETSLITSQLRYMLLKHRLKLARAKDAYLLRRRVVEQLEMLLHRVNREQKKTIQQPVPAEWDTDTSSLVTDIIDESVLSGVHSRNTAFRPHGTTTLLSMGRKIPADLEVKKPVNTGCHSVPRENTVTYPDTRGRSSTRRGIPTKASLPDSALLEQSSVQTRCEKLVSCDSEEFQSLYKLRDRAEKQLAEMITAMKVNFCAQSNSRETQNISPANSPIPSSRVVAWAEEYGRMSMSHGHRSPCRDVRNDRLRMAAEARASNGGVTWFQPFSPVPVLNEASSSKQPLVKIIREPSKANYSTRGDTHPIDKLKSLATHELRNTSTTISERVMDDFIPVTSSVCKPSDSVVTRCVRDTLVVCETQNAHRRSPCGDLMISKIESGANCERVKIPVSAVKENKSSSPPLDTEEEPTESFFSGAVTTPRGIAFALSTVPEHHSSRTYPVMTDRSAISEIIRYEEEGQPLCHDLQTLFKQRMAHWISRSKERQKRIKLAAFERRYSRAVQAERVQLFRASRDLCTLQQDAHETARSALRDAVSCCSAQSREPVQKTTPRSRQSSIFSGLCSPHVHPSPKPISSSQKCVQPQSRTRASITRVRPMLPRDQQRRAMENKLSQLRTNRLRMKIYGEVSSLFDYTMQRL
ncbi:unnamed protein product, partial [Echinostoma caproni]|uniref:ALMS_motif domain-containing protein n=1 Tax=Echinostoma caproni TaxID=27848 RepID=A0A183A610_9TREM